MMDGKGYFDGPGGKPPVAKKVPMAKPSDKDGDEQQPVATISVKKNADGGHTFSHDAQDGMPSDDYNSVAELAKGLEEKYGEDKVEDAEEKVSPGVHQKAGDYLSKAIEQD
jgi:hypothetical protein